MFEIFKYLTVWDYLLVLLVPLPLLWARNNAARMRHHVELMRLHKGGDGE